MSDQPKKQELPPIEENETDWDYAARLYSTKVHAAMVNQGVSCARAEYVCSIELQNQLLAALSDNEALRADNEAKAARSAELEKESAKWKSHSEAAWERADGTFMDTLGLVTRNQAAAAKLKSVEGMLKGLHPDPMVLKLRAIVEGKY